MVKSPLTKILLLADTPAGAAEVEEAQTVIKKLMRKFRKTVQFDFIPPIFISDYKNSYASINFISKELREHNAVLWGRASSYSPSDNLYDFCADNGVYAVERCILGKSIISPFCKSELTNTNQFSKFSKHLTKTTASLATGLAFKKARQKKGAVSFCIGSRIKEDELLFGKFEEDSLMFHDIQTDILNAFEFIWDISDYKNSNEVILASEKTADMLLYQISAIRKNLDGYICLHSEKNRIYCRIPIPYERFGNYKTASTLFACAAMTEHEFGMKNAAAWLRRAIGISNIFCEDTSEEYIKNVIRAVSGPIRMRKIK